MNNLRLGRQISIIAFLALEATWGDRPTQNCNCVLDRLRYSTPYVDMILSRAILNPARGWRHKQTKGYEVVSIVDLHCI